MNSSQKHFISAAKIVRALNLPHLYKYIFFLFLKNKEFPVNARLDLSKANVKLNLGDFIEYWIFMDGLYERDWVNQANQLTKNKTFIDIGANIGNYSLSLYKSAKQVYAIEPEEKNVKKISDAIKKNAVKNIHIIKKAIYSKNIEKAKLFLSTEDHGWHSLAIHYQGGMQTTETITLDSLVHKNNIKDIGLIKIDVEGAEIDVIKGAKKTLEKNHPPILIEFNMPFSKKAGHRLDELYKTITQYGYTGFKLRNKRLIEVKSTDVEKIYNENLLFL